jgi:quercetin dioxygenase-like cupin family protein
MSTQLVHEVEQKSFEAPDETRSFERGKAELISIGNSEIGRLTFEPGWKWSEHLKPIAGTDLCEAPHFQYHVQGVMRVQLEDGTEFDAHPGDVTSMPRGHDAWVIGDEAVVVVDWYGASDYAKR